MEAAEEGTEVGCTECPQLAEPPLAEPRTQPSPPLATSKRSRAEPVAIPACLLQEDWPDEQPQPAKRLKIEGPAVAALALRPEEDFQVLCRLHSRPPVGIQSLCRPPALPMILPVTSSQLHACLCVC